MRPVTPTTPVAQLNSGFATAPTPAPIQAPTQVPTPLANSGFATAPTPAPVQVPVPTPMSPAQEDTSSLLDDLLNTEPTLPQQTVDMNYESDEEITLNDVLNI